MKNFTLNWNVEKYFYLIISVLPILLLLFFCSAAIAQIQGETKSLTPFKGEIGTHLIAMPTYTYSRMPGTLGLKADEETWSPDKWKNRQVFNRFVPIMDWEAKPSGIWFYTGNELGDMLWQELSSAGEEPNNTPMLYGGFNVPISGEFYALAEFNQIDHFSEDTFNRRKERINSQKFSWFGENLPAYSNVFGGAGYKGTGDFFKDAYILTGSEYLWAWDEEEWNPIRISPRVEANASFYFMENEIEMNATTEKFQIQDSAAESRSSFGIRLKGKNTGGGLHVTRVNDKEDILAWRDFNHSFFHFFANGGFIALSSQDDFFFADSLEFKYDISNSTDLIFGVLARPNGIKTYGETDYESKPIFAKTKIYQNYDKNFQSIGFDAELAYKSRIAEAGVVYSREFFEYYRDTAFYDVLPAENSAKIFLKYRFLQNLSFAHEWVYRSDVYNRTPKLLFWNAQAEQRIPEWNTSLYAVLLNAISKDNKDFSFGGVNRAKFYCGVKTDL